MENINHIKESYLYDLSIRGYKKSTVYCYKKDLEMFIAYMESNISIKEKVLSLTEIQKKHLNGFKNHIQRIEKYSQATTKRIFNSLRTFYKYCATQYNIDNIMLSEKFGKKKDMVYLKGIKREKIISSDELKIIFDNLKRSKESTRNLTIFYILLKTGISPSEVVNLKWSGFSYVDRLIHIKRGYLQVAIPLSQDLCHLIKTHYLLEKEKKINSLYIFQSYSSNKCPMSINTLNTIYKSAIKDTGLSGGLKSFQVTFITDCLKNDVSLQKIAYFTGHKRVDSLNIYKDLV